MSFSWVRAGLTAPCSLECPALRHGCPRRAWATLSQQTDWPSQGGPAMTPETNAWLVFRNRL